MVTVYADATIAFPILALYVLSNQKTRKPKRLYKKLNELYSSLSEDYFKNPDNKTKKKN
jgi:deoxyhypusine synthase